MSYLSMKERYGKTNMKHQIVKVGYIFNKKYQYNFQYNTEIGLKERRSLMEKLENCFADVQQKDTDILHVEKVNRGNNLSLLLQFPDQNIQIDFDTINSIVGRNKDRKISGKQFYPYDKSMDKYNSVYVVAYSNNVTEDTHEIVNRILARLLSEMNLYDNKFEYKSMNYSNVA